VIGAAAGRLAVRVVNSALDGSEPVSKLVEDFRVRFCRTVDIHQRTIYSLPIIDAARRRGIPVSWLDYRSRFVELGSGAYRRRICGGTTSLMPSFGEEIARDKVLTHHYLRNAGLPVPAGRSVGAVDRALRAAAEIGYPVVTKPPDQGGAAGLRLNLRNEDELREGFHHSLSASPSGRVLVEQYLTGQYYRITVVDGRVCNVVQIVPARVVGDGEHSVAQLIEIANTDPRRGPRRDNPLYAIPVDDVVHDHLTDQGLTLNSIPERGRLVRLRTHPLMKTGGYSIELTDQIHPDNRAIAAQAVSVLGLDVALVDLIAQDIRESIWATTGGILEINTHSGFQMQMWPAEGSGFDPGPPIVDMLFPPGQPVRAPLVAVAGAPAAAVSEAVAALLTAAGRSVGLANRDGVSIGGVRFPGRPGRNPEGPRMVLNNPATEIAVVEVEVEAFVERGLGFSICDVLLLMGPLDDPGIGLRSPAEALIETTEGWTVARAGDELLPGIDRVPASRLCLIGLDRDAHRLHAHRERGRATVALDGEGLAAVTWPGRPDAVVAIGAARRSERGEATLEHLAAIAAAVALGLPEPAIQAALDSPVTERAKR
jgi:cyanophycin synthetase